MYLHENFVLTSLDHWESKELAAHGYLSESDFEFSEPDRSDTDSIRAQYMPTGARRFYICAAGWVQRFARDVLQGKFQM